MMGLWKSIGGLALPLALGAGCAKLDYVKVPSPTQYGTWTDEDQRQADAMKGVRYYLPRPFLHLRESVPVSQRAAFISFRFDEAAKAYLLEPPQDAPSWLRKVAPPKISITQALAATMARAEVTGEGEEQAGEVGGEKKEPPPAPPEAPPSTLKARTGFINQTDPVTALGEKMDVVYLPDFEEQYVIQPRTGLGQADIETRLRNGWAAEVFAQELDNSNLIPYVIRQVEKASEAAAGIATTWMPLAAGLPPGTSPATVIDLAAKAGKLQAGEVGEGTGEDLVKDVLGQVLLFKIAEVRIAQPGIYPILKPREIKQWLRYDGEVSGPDPEDTFESFLAQARVPWIRPDMAFIPCPPFTMVGFNATTDVFLAPATERAVLSAGPEGPQNGKGPTGDGDARKIKAAIWNSNKGTLGSDGTTLQEQGIIVQPGRTGNQTIIELGLPGNVSFVSDLDTLKNWAKPLFKIENDADMTVEKKDNRIVITILQNIVDVARKVGTP